MPALVFAGEHIPRTMSLYSSLENYKSLYIMLSHKSRENEVIHSLVVLYCEWRIGEQD